GDWDTHAGTDQRSETNFSNLRRKLPVYDRAISALLSDLYARGLDQDVVVWSGASSAARRASTPTGAAITGPRPVLPWFRAAALTWARWSATPALAPSVPAAFRTPPPTCSPRSTASWASTRP